MSNPILDMSNEHYHGTPAISKSRIDMFAQDPHRVEWASKCPQDQEKIKTFDFGDAVHAICLEPDRLVSEFVEAPAFNLRSNAGKEEKAEFYAANEGKKILTAEEYTKLKLMFESVMAHPAARALIEAQGVAEGSWFWKDAETGLDCKCRPDKQIGNKLIDIKSTPDLKKFAYSVQDYRYHVQDPWYCDGLLSCGVDAPHMEFLAIQKTIEIGRYPVMVVRLPEEIIEYGRMIYRQNLRDYADFLDHGQAETMELQVHHRFLNEVIEAIVPEIRYE